MSLPSAWGRERGALSSLFLLILQTTLSFWFLSMWSPHREDQPNGTFTTAALLFVTTNGKIFMSKKVHSWSLSSYNKHSQYDLLHGDIWQQQKRLSVAVNVKQDTNISFGQRIYTLSPFLHWGRRRLEVMLPWAAPFVSWVSWSDSSKGLFEWEAWSPAAAWGSRTASRAGWVNQYLVVPCHTPMDWQELRDPCPTPYYLASFLPELL